MFLIIGSKDDPCSNTIYNFLLKMEHFIDKNEYKQHSFLPIHLKLINGEIVFIEEFKDINYSEIIFLSRHESKLQNKTLCVHTPGNFGSSSGGKTKKLSRSCPWLIKSLLIELKRLNNIEYEVWNEPTHHGPYCETPCVFIEIGTTIEEWEDKRAGEVIANALINVIKDHKDNNKEYKNAIYLGGLHYSEKSRRVLLETEYALGHICPKGKLELIDEDLLSQMIDNTGNIKKIFIEKKSFISGEKKQELLKMLEKTGIEINKI